MIVRKSSGPLLVCQDHGKNNASVVVLVHGFPLDHRMWEPQIKALSAEHRVLAVDLAGFGGSPLPEGMMTMDRYAAGLVSLLTDKGINQPVHLAGFSMGGYVALAFMRQFPARAASLMLVDTKAAPDTPEAAQGRAKLAKQVLAEGAGVVADAMIPKLLSKQNQASKPELVKQVREIMMDQPPASIAAALDAMARRPDSTPGLSSIKIPTLIIVGSDDVITPPEEMRKVAAEIPMAKVVEIPGAGHLTTLEAPDVVNAAMLKQIMA